MLNARRVTLGSGTSRQRYNAAPCGGERHITRDMYWKPLPHAIRDDRLAHRLSTRNTGICGASRWNSLKGAFWSTDMCGRAPGARFKYAWVPAYAFPLATKSNWGQSESASVNSGLGAENSSASVHGCQQVRVHALIA